MRIFFSSTNIVPSLFDGDVLIVRENYEYKFYYCYNKDIKLIESIKTIKSLHFISDYEIVLDYSDMNQRHGNLYALDFLLTVFRNPIVVSFIKNAIDISLYNDDKWDVSLIQKLISTRYDHEKSSSIKESFVDYLEKKVIDYFKLQINNGDTKSDAFRKTKRMFPYEFSTALRLFKRDYPERSIYE